MLVRQHGTGAGLAADADKAAFVQAVIGQLQHADVTPDFLAGHLRQRVEFVQRSFRGREGAVDFQRGNLAAGARALVATLARGPGGDGRQFAAQRLDFAHTAAFAMAVFVKAEQAFFFDEGLKLVLVW